MNPEPMPRPIQLFINEVKLTWVQLLIYVHTALVWAARSIWSHADRVLEDVRENL